MSSRTSSDTSIEAALKSAKLLECISKGSGEIGSRFAVQSLCLDEPGTSGRVPEGAFKVTSGLGVVVGARPTGSVAACNREPSESDVVDDHIRLGKHQIVTIACIVVSIGAWYVEQLGTAEGGEAVGGASCSGELSPGGARPR
jgi:hypothetical protein